MPIAMPAGSRGTGSCRPWGQEAKLGPSGNMKQVRDWWQEPPLISEIPTAEVCEGREPGCPGVAAWLRSSVFLFSTLPAAQLLQQPRRRSSSTGAAHEQRCCLCKSSRNVGLGCWSCPSSAPGPVRLQEAGGTASLGHDRAAPLGPAPPALTSLTTGLLASCNTRQASGSLSWK